MAAQILGGGGEDSPLLCRSYRFPGRVQCPLAAGLDLHEGNILRISGNYVNLPEAAADIGGLYGIPLFPQETGRQNLPCRAGGNPGH